MGMPVITPSSTTRSQAVTDIIESVALQETALSHILNAEGEKIQKMVALPDVTPEILHSKLSTFGGCLCEGGTSSTVQ